MFSRPRCRDWTPLVTQQLRLRNLIQITGHNIVSSEKCSVYYTLHMTSMSSPFFTSETCDSPKNAIWSEINIQNISELGSRSVCIRIWEHRNTLKINGETTNTTKHEESDKLLFLWGVYFSGLIQIPNWLNLKFKENSLVLHMHGGYFVAPNSIISDICVSPSISPKKLNTFELERESIKDNFTIIPKYTSEKHDKSLNVILKESHESILNGATNQIVRYTFKDFLKSEVRPSYNVKKLLQLQELQRSIKYKIENSKELMEKICMKSAFCLNLELIANKSVIYHRHYQSKNQRVSGMGRTLNRLLFQQIEPPKPETLLKAQQIRREIEIARFRCRLLTQEKDRTNVQLRHYGEKLSKLTENNSETEIWLMSHYRSLNKEKELCLQERIMFAGQKEIYSNMKLSLQCRKFQLLKELNDIYSIKFVNKIYVINGILLPDAESYDAVKTPPSDLSVALGYVAHVVLLCSIILNVPLRNNIIYEGSRSKIVDNIKMLPAHNREFPLYSKECPPPNELLYGVFLLNQNIAQLKFLLGLSKTDLRATLLNLYQLLNGPPKDLPMKHLILENISTNQVSMSNSSIDLDCIVIPLHNNMPSIPKIHNIGNRISRSFDSYTENNIKPERKFTSEPLLSNKNNNEKYFKNFN